MGVLRLRVVSIEVGETHVGNRLPVARHCLDVAVIFMVERVFFYALIELEGHIECLMVASGTSILRQAIDHEANGIELFLRVAWLAEVVQTPISAAILRVDEVVEDVVFGTCCGIKVFRLAEHTIGCRERPEDASVQDSTFVGRLHEFAAARHLSVEAAMLVVLHLFEPEAQNVVFQYFLHLCSERCDLFATCGTAFHALISGWDICG